ncbi:ATP-binding protein [Luteolibacter sp. SL250]|uniref:ATP-binding protein n=1 Tax=Luteolibacter sp. SL250 TaxID=2995170 RepID=UPI002270A8AE|nr:ATP-binding protein [Luteolibacter sp. SL250]WAC21888.1 ATP-binding protein [Luteolibacter sp. SL250]
MTPPAEARFSRISVPLITSLIVALCGLLYWQAGQLRSHHRWVSHSYQVRLEIEELDRNMREAESIQRAMLLTGSQSSVLRENFDKLLESVRAHHANLRQLVTDNKEQSALVDAVTPFLFSRLETLDRNSNDLRNLNGSGRSERILAGVAETDRIEDLLEEIRKLEDGLLTERADATHSAGSRLLMLATGGSALGVVVMIIAMFQEARNRKQRRQYQDRLAEARDTALDSVKATSVFVASVSHEIRTPMNGVLGAADLLRRDDRLDRRQIELVDTIRYSGEALLDLVNDILDLSKLQAGKMEFIREDFSLAEVLDESLALFADAAGKKHLELAHRINSELPRHLRGDPRRVRQVLINLVGNAVKFTEKGSVSIEVTSRGQEEDDRPVLLFRITDTGPGVSKEEQQHLFQAFTQVNIKLNRRHSGTGLGLAISREIVERMGGTMGVESVPGQGSTFWFTARFDRATVAEDQSERLCDGGTLLLIESREITATSVAQHVDAWGMRVTTADDAPTLDGIGVIPDLAAVVIGQPHSESWEEVATKIRERADAAGKPMFLLNHGAEEPSPAALARAGIGACLRFPFRPSDLYNLLTTDNGPTSTAPHDDENPLPAARILLVEDNPINQRIFGRQLEVLGMEVEFRGDGGDGVAARQQETFDLILMDCQLPTMDGFEATQRIREWEAGTGSPRVPIIAITAHVMIGDAEACYQAGMDDYLPKPFDLTKLKAKLGRWLVTQETEDQASAPAEETMPVLDATQLTGCLTGDAALDESLLSDSLEEIHRGLDRMKGAIDTTEDAVWRSAAHRALGTAAVLGFAELASLLRSAEHDDGDWTKRAAGFRLFQPAVARVRVALGQAGHLPAEGTMRSA